jgi:L-threonylcarbamoyladenylate synthase
MTDFSEDIEHCLAALEKGDTILYPTDTIWGLGCDATNANAVEKIYAIKERPANKSMIVLVADERDVLQYVSGLDLQVFDYLEQVQKPTTVIYDGAIGLADNVINADGSVAIRIVKEPFCKHLIKRFRRPIVSTSANISGQEAPSVFNQVSEVVKQGVGYIVKYRQEEMKPAEPSSIIRWKEGKAITIR